MGTQGENEVPDAVAAMVQWAILNGVEAIFLLRTRLMDTSCALTWRESDDLEKVCVINPSHPIAQGLGRYFELSAEETYGQPFGIPEMDTTVFTGWYEGGEGFRSGCCRNRGNGNIIYFQPGHEMYPIYKDANVQRVIINAVHWCRPTYREISLNGCRNLPSEHKL